jgi:hypothetical protein
MTATVLGSRTTFLSAAPDGSVRPEFRPHQRHANIVQVVVRDPKLVRTFRQARKFGCDQAQQGGKFKPCGAPSISLCEITLMISSFVSGYGHRGLLATGGAPQEAGCIACDRNARGGVRRQPLLQPQSHRGASVSKIKGRRWIGAGEGLNGLRGIRKFTACQGLARTVLADEAAAPLA